MKSLTKRTAAARQILFTILCVAGLAWILLSQFKEPDTMTVAQAQEREAKSALPRIDVNAPTEIETATFALG